MTEFEVESLGWKQEERGSDGEPLDHATFFKPKGCAKPWWSGPDRPVATLKAKMWLAKYVVLIYI